MRAAAAGDDPLECEWGGEGALLRWRPLDARFRVGEVIRAELGSDGVPGGPAVSAEPDR